MFVRNLYDCDEIVAGDNCLLRELLHGPKDGLELGYSIAHAIVKPGDTTFNASRVKNPPWLSAL
ncbi:MAG: hypothetical protein GXO64_03620 [Candidatus Micrarchaeota archaeon]|nr:hypothetical protein [Candidatus Micrarchaeota archaeon]